MNITFDDPRLTAYALDELDEAARSVIESEMQNFGQCRREVEELTRAVALVRAGLASEPTPALLPAQQQAIEAKLRRTCSKPKLSWIPATETGSAHWLLKAALAAAVVLLMSVVRIPAVMNPSLSFLQNASTDTAYVMMRVAGMGVEKHGLVLRVAADAFHQDQIVRFEMALSNCTPFYPNLILLVTSLLLGNLYLRSPWKRLLLTLFVIPLMIVKDGLRAFTIAELCVHLGPRSAIDSPIHHHSGPIFFALSLIPFIFLLVWLRKLESKP